MALSFSPAPVIAVRTDRQGQPQGFQWRRRWRTVAAVRRTWRVETEWWRGAGEAVGRAYYDVRAHDGLRCIVYRDVLADTWHPEQIIDQRPVCYPAAMSDGHGHQPADSMPDADRDTDAAMAASSPALVNPSARAQLEAIRDEWLVPLVAQIAEQAERIGQLQAERDGATSKLAAKDETIAELRRRAEVAEAEVGRLSTRIDKQVAAATLAAQAAPHATEAPPGAPVGLLARLRRLLAR